MIITELSLTDCNKWRKEIELLIKDAITVSFFNNQPNVDYYTEKVEELIRYVMKGSAILLGAVEGDRLIGLIWCHSIQRFNEKRLHIANIAVSAQERNRGIGKELLTKAEEYANKNYYVGIDLLVTKENYGAVNFYRNNGFEEERFLMKKCLK